jgi:outer membrane protein assembly factor BamB
MLWGNLLIVDVDGRDVQYVIALDKATGKTVWRTKRSVDFSVFQENIRKAFCTPIVIDVGGRLQLVSPGAKATMGYDPASGAELWKVRYNGWSVTPRPVFSHGLVFIVTDYEHPELWAVRPNEAGEFPASQVAWKLTKMVPSRPSLLVIDDLLYMVSSTGIATCVEAETGRLVWQKRIGGAYSASPIYADGRIYFFSHEAASTVIKPGRQFKVLAVNKLDKDDLMASPAVAGKALFVRTRSHLYRIEKRDKGLARE